MPFARGNKTLTQRQFGGSYSASCAVWRAGLYRYLPFQSLGFESTPYLIETWSEPLMHLLLLAAAVIAALRSLDRAQRRFWLWTAATLSLFLAGNVFETIAWIEGRSAILSWDDGYFYGAYALMIGYQWRVLASEGRSLGFTRTFVDYVTTILAGALVIWFVLKGDVSQHLHVFTPSERIGLISFATLGRPWWRSRFSRCYSRPRITPPWTIGFMHWRASGGPCIWRRICCGTPTPSAAIPGTRHQWPC